MVVVVGLGCWRGGAYRCRVHVCGIGVNGVFRRIDGASIDVLDDSFESEDLESSFVSASVL